ncbi:carbamoyltransferase N-terminal domain-containing protein [Streptomyces sp. NPDC086549]|uniref:carbamoyltransferase N-terminal domain-containing protein n=1 Tax=Streptomyces sp. NPDC086549 TaxID=3365752 RepID=UPI0038231FBC
MPASTFAVSGCGLDRARHHTAAALTVTSYTRQSSVPAVLLGGTLRARPGGVAASRVCSADSSGTCDINWTSAAAYVQAETEHALCALAEQTIAATGLGNLCFAGGVALNCVAADKLRRLDTVTSYFAPPAAPTAAKPSAAPRTPGTGSPATCPGGP